MFELKKSQYPNLWTLIKMGSVFHWARPDNMCQLIRRIIYGCMISLFIIFAGAYIASFLLDPLIGFCLYLSTGYFSYFFSEGHMVVGLTLYFLFGFAVILGGSIYLVVLKDIFNLKNKLSNRKPGIVSTWYDGFSNKFCPTVEMIDDHE